MSEVLIGGVGYRWHGDGSFGLAVSDYLATLEWPASVMVADLGYGAIYAAQDIAAAHPARLILLAAAVRGGAPGAIRRYQYDGPLPSDDEILARVREAGAGVIDLDHLLIIGRQMQAFPPDVLVIEIEPLELDAGAELSPVVQARVPEVVDMVRREASVQVQET